MGVLLIDGITAIVKLLGWFGLLSELTEVVVMCRMFGRTTSLKASRDSVEKLRLPEPSCETY